MREDIEAIRRQIIQDRACYLSVEECERRVGALVGVLGAFRRIREIVHAPTPGAEKAHRHYQRDFDEIRKLVEPYC